MADFTFASFGAALGKLAVDLTVDERRKITEAMAKRGQVLATRAAAADLGGDPAFSGWKGKAGTPMPLDTRTIRQDDGATMLAPTRMSAGLWTVANDGRRGYVAGDRRKSGTRTRKTDGVVVDKFRKVKRNTGPTPAKRTAEDARHLMEVDPELRRIAEQGVNRSIKKLFG